MSIHPGDARFISVTTYRRNGEGGATPVWCTPIGTDGRFGFYTTKGTGKTKRLRRDPRVTVAPCSRRGEVRPGAPVVTGTAAMIHDGPVYDQVIRDIKRKYRWEYPIFATIGRRAAKKDGLHDQDTVVVITPTSAA